VAGRAHGHVKVDARYPRAAGICDRCGFAYNHNRLTWQFDWAGERLQNLRILVCDKCLDVPQQQLRAKILAPDPVPIFNARPEPFTTTGFSYEESNIMQMPRTYGVPDFQDARSGLYMLMPDGITVMLMPNNPSGA
jgi:hypothetical protein